MSDPKKTPEPSNKTDEDGLPVTERPAEKRDGADGAAPVRRMG